MVAHVPSCTVMYTYMLEDTTNYMEGVDFLSLTQEQLDEFGDVLFLQNVKNYCNNSDLAIFKDANVTLKHSYLNTDRFTVVSHKINQTDCKELMSGGSY